MMRAEEVQRPIDPGASRREAAQSTGWERITTVGIAADHGGFALKEQLVRRLREAGYQVRDFGAGELAAGDDYPDFVAPLARAVATGSPQRGVAICGSGVGASVVANKIPQVRAGLCGDTYSAHQGVEDDDMNVLCIGARVTGGELAWELVRVFLAARFLGDERFRRRLEKITALERKAPAAARSAAKVGETER
jgi:ribose 5-phosphate isomerase B